MGRKHPKRAYLASIWFVILIMSITACSMPFEKRSAEEPAQSASLTPEVVSEAAAEKSGEDVSVETEAAVSESSGSAEDIKDAQPESEQPEGSQTEEAQPEDTPAEEPAAEAPEPAEPQPEEISEETPTAETEPEETLPEGDRIDILAGNDITYQSMYSKGIQWEWSEDHLLYVQGTSEGKSFTNMYSDPENLPNGVEPGDELYTELEIDDENIRMEFLFYLSDGTYFSVVRTESGTVEVPSDAIGLSMRPYVPKSVSVDGVMRRFELYKTVKNPLPLIVSFIDDDTTNNKYIHRYHDACVKNGIPGNYAIITSHLTEGATSADTLLFYQEQGFGMLAHCSRQTGSKYWRGEGWSRSPEELEECRQDLLECRDVLESYGFIDSLLWVSPFGIHDEDIQIVAQEVGMECLFSIGTDGINTTDDWDRWNIKRFSLTADDTTEGKTLEDAKARINQCVEQGSGWLIITTHFNTWGDLYWDETPDENGNATGYERFNEIVQYALAAGMTPMTMQEAYRNYYEPILEANNYDYDYEYEYADDIG